MQLSTLKAKHPRKSPKRIGRGGKRGTTSGKGTKGQSSRAGASTRAGFRGGDNRIWQLFPKQRGASSKPGNKSPHRKHRYYSIRRYKPWELNLRALEVFKDGDVVSLASLIEKKVLPEAATVVKILATGELNRKLSFSGVLMSATARAKIEKAGGTILE
ncbi:MAG: 50S ribosomal protein L15 [Candidatus Pacebacteria bacterium]|nr:50S ribosomal protein L15 [Candidatus Paceibacterota bacterium]